MSKKRIISKFMCRCVWLGLGIGGSAQTGLVSKIDADLYGDAVSSYVWRGIKQTGFSIQPSLTFSLGDFSLGAWGSTDFNEGADQGFKEVDFTASYSVSDFTIAVTDYWWDGEGARHYFSSPREGYSGHMLEGSLSYKFSEKFPLSVGWNTFFLGEGNKKENGDNSFSTFVEFAYPFSLKDLNLDFAVGFTPWESAVYGTTGFKFTQIKLGVSKNIKITESFTLPVFGNLIANPEREDMHFVFGIRIQ
jgi:hypothetical protein